MEHLLNAIPTWLIMLVVAILVLAMNEIGFQAGRVKRTESAEGTTPKGNSLSP